MPGRTASEALRNYIDPLQAALSCLDGVAKVRLTERVHQVGDTGAWILNGPDGMSLRDFGTLHAQQRFELVATSEEHRAYRPPEKFRISTREYIYKLEMQTGQQIRWHWHPMGNSPERRPHIHPSFNIKAHLPGSRVVLEDIIEGCIELGAKPSCDDWKARLMETGGVHKLYRTWVDDPDERRRRAD
ncbi:hypothetical protein MMAD_13660 [Mycolicibacterium madagascariense]|uniref:Uncharacterized protein n=1 Tax=Mycolicibacterium madagascariense TaxID=212765 RepID=A0A7I7XE14_9MYCO|nr:hypothetical protein [Mycolicibacterium madagascariense]BBZ27071.1 hypothetical protein MMAD_13660 [Mycolicibacterium madagascariense]